jgi:putative endonuclease
MASLLPLNKGKVLDLAAKQAAFAAGKAAEDKALDYLQHQGLQLIQRNFRCKVGEIDLIMQQGAIVAFVEVKYRQDKTFGGALFSISTRQQQRIIRAASLYLARFAPDSQARFDVIAVDNDNLQWLPNAFTADYYS